MTLTRHSPGERLARHRHRQGYIALVLEGGFVEAGDGARIGARPGDVIVHEPFDAHADAFTGRRSVVLNLPFLPGLDALGRVDDADEAARLAERDPWAAARWVALNMAPGRERCADWPDLLAEALSGEAEIGLAEWARGVGVRPQSLSRGFRQAYGVSPKRYRLEQRVRAALRRLPGWRGTLAALAAEAGFADQAHLTRAVAAITGRTPHYWRVQSVQAARR